MSQSTRTLSPAQKAARTRQARKQFTERFGSQSLVVLSNLLRNKEVSFLDSRSLAAYKANLTRGTYGEFVRVTSTGKVTKNLIAV